MTNPLENYDQDEVDEQLQEETRQYLKRVFEINGAVELIKADEAKELLQGARISLIRFNDWKRGIFYLAKVVPRK